MDETTSFDDFFGAIDGDTGYQTGDTDSTTDTTDTPADEPTGEDAAQQPAEDAQDGENTDHAEGGDNAEQPAGSPAPADTFTLRVNKSDMTVGRDDMIVYAQKGVDYDRVKGALEQARSDNTALQERVSQTEEVYNLISDLAKESNMEVADLLDQFRLARYKSQGMSADAARERLGREKAERELATLKGKADAQKTETDARQERAQREVAEFNRRYPGVSLNDTLVDRLKADVHAGMTLSEAYQKMVNEDQAAEIQRLQNELAAKKQNDANRGSSPGSLGDSGAKKAPSQYDDFFSAFND